MNRDDGIERPDEGKLLAPDRPTSNILDNVPQVFPTILQAQFQFKSIILIISFKMIMACL